MRSILIGSSKNETWKHFIERKRQQANWRKENTRKNQDELNLIWRPQHSTARQTMLHKTLHSSLLRTCIEIHLNSNWFKWSWRKRIKFRLDFLSLSLSRFFRTLLPLAFFTFVCMCACVSFSIYIFWPSFMQAILFHINFLVDRLVFNFFYSCCLQYSFSLCVSFKISHRPKSIELLRLCCFLSIVSLISIKITMYMFWIDHKHRI